MPTYGVLLATALIAALIAVVRLGRREGLDSGRLLDLSTWLAVVGLLGAKALMVVTDWEFYWEHPGELFAWETLRAGGVFYGGFLAAAFLAVWYVRAHALPLWKVFDVYAPALALGLGIGRLGCFSAGCDYGQPTTSFLGVVFTDPFSREVTGVPLGIPLHPTQLYESLACFLIFGVLLWRYRRKTRDGEIFALYLGLYAVARFFIEFLRGDEDRGFVFNHLLSTSQLFAVGAMVLAAILVISLRGRARTAPQAAAAASASAPKRARS